MLLRVASKTSDADGLQAMKQLYREHGWPDAFRKDEFLKAAVPARATILDDEYDWSDE